MTPAEPAGQPDRAGKLASHGYCCEQEIESWVRQVARLRAALARGAVIEARARDLFEVMPMEARRYLAEFPGVNVAWLNLDVALRDGT